jgi:indole-3-glycerol phosphate synthase
VPVLDRIVETKRAEVAALAGRAAELRAAAAAAAPPPDFEAALRHGPNVAVIAEMKRRSPSAGAIRGDASASTTARVYADAGAAAISVLTDADYFGGALADLEAVAAATRVPLLRKDFTIEAVQVYEARAAGAAAVLLIVRILDDDLLRELRLLAESLGMAALVEAHDAAEIERAVASGARIIGINNRDLATFETDLGVTEQLAPLVRYSANLSKHAPILVGESGIRTAADVRRLAAAGVDAVLVGESLMRASDPAAALRELAGVVRAG